MNRFGLLLLMLAMALLAVGCDASDPPPPAATTAASAATAPATALLPTVAATATAAAPVATLLPAPSPTAAAQATPAPTRTGADYVLRLPREDAVPSDWAMSPQPDFETRAPRPGETYHFACRDLPARSIGIATVGYRHLDGLPSVAIEYVIYPTAEDASAALADMRVAAGDCDDFTIGAGDTATAASFAPLEPPAAGEEGFAAALTTTNPISGDLVTHLVKVRQNHVIIGISHTARVGEAPPDEALTRALIETALNNLRDGPRPSGPSAARPAPYALSSRRLSRIM